jgi:hypothetical protein
MSHPLPLLHLHVCPLIIPCRFHVMIHKPWLIQCKHEAKTILASPKSSSLALSSTSSKSTSCYHRSNLYRANILHRCLQTSSLACCHEYRIHCSPSQWHMETCSTKTQHESRGLQMGLSYQMKGRWLY